jgi:triphosphoribosyl-dephospho-CoA synthase
MHAQLACILEATARKPGNVHRFRDFEDAHYLDFMVSSTALWHHLTPDRVRQDGLGRVIRDALEETRGLIGHNTNLGMILLLAPLAAAEDGWAIRGCHAPASQPGRFDRVAEGLRGEVAEILSGTSVEDARAVYEAIRLARPGGLGSASEQDVAGEPTVTLLEAMRLAADRDAIARQYATGYADVFELALPTLGEALRLGRPLEAAIVLTHLSLMAERPDTLIARKCGEVVALESARKASGVLSSGWPDAPESVEEIRGFDDWLRADGHRRNPGATADLIAATLYAALHDGTIEIPRHLRRSGWDAGDVL